MSQLLPPEAYEAARRNAESAPLPSPERRARLRLILWGARAQAAQPPSASPDRSAAAA